MKKYRSKPLEIEAVRWNWEDYNLDEIKEWSCGEVVSSKPHKERYDYLDVKTQNGDVLAHPGDWIIKDSDGVFYPCKDSVFQKKYEVVDG